MMNSEDLVLAAAAAVISGTLLLLARRLQKSFQGPLHHHSSPPILQQCISSSSSDEKKREKKKKKKKRVHFAKDMAVSSRTRKEDGEGKEARRNYRESSSEMKVRNGRIEENRGMPANRVVLFNEILKDRAAQRLANSY